jgi:acyl-coenzyme A thioesterase PaaI-like protein
MTAEPAYQHLMSELGFAMTQNGSELFGAAPIIEEMCVPGVPHLRTSILATWVDHLAGLLAAQAMTPRVPVTLQLDVDLIAPAPGSGLVRGTGRVLKTGRSVFFAGVEFDAGDGEVFAVGTGCFMAAPDVALNLPPNLSLEHAPPAQTLRLPLARRAGCERLEPGVSALPRSDDGLNSANTVHGGLLALVVEEAVLSLSPAATLSSLNLRYLRPVRVGPAVATAQTSAGLGQIEVRDAGNGDRLSVLATARQFDR